MPPLPADQDRYDLTALSEVLAEVADGAAGLVDHRAFVQPVEGVRDLAEYADVDRVEELLSPRPASAVPSLAPSGSPTPPCGRRTPAS